MYNSNNQGGSRSNSSRPARKKTEDSIPDITTAWLFLSHAGFIAIEVALTVAATTLYYGSKTRHPKLLRGLIGLIVGTSLLLGVLTEYAIYKTWRAAMVQPQVIFGTMAFVWLAIINLLVMLIAALNAAVIF